MPALNTVFQGEYRIASGWNNASALTGLEGVFVANDFLPFKTFKSWGTYSPGDPVVRGDGTIVFDGYPSCSWVFGIITRLQVQYLQDTYCGGGYSGKVTIRTSTDNVNATTALPAYENYSAVMRLSPVGERKYYKQYVISFTRLVAL